MRTIEQTAADIDANRNGLLSRVRFLPATAAEYQHSWDRCPDLHMREHALFAERGETQVERDRLAEIEYRREQRKEAAKRAVATRQANIEANRPRRQCPTCGCYSLAA